MAPTLAGVFELQSFPSQIDERRDPPTRERLLARVQCEFDEDAGLVVTLAEAGRLFGMRHDICHRVLRELVAKGVLCTTSRNRYAKRLPLQ